MITTTDKPVLRMNAGATITLKVVLQNYKFEMTGPADEVERAIKTFYTWVADVSSISEPA